MRRRPLVFIGVWSAAVVMMAGCASRHIGVPAYRTQPAGPGAGFIAGAARVDITPAAGAPMGGHSLGGRVSQGRWGRLFARAFYLRDAEGHSAALVSVD